MQAKVSQNGEITVVHLVGRINYETVDPFRKTCLENFREGKLVFNLQNLSFVGSSGITSFVQTIEDIARTNGQGLKLCSVGSEFKKIFDASEIAGLEIFEEQNHAESAFFAPAEPEAPEMAVPNFIDGPTSDF